MSPRLTLSLLAVCLVATFSTSTARTAVDWLESPGKSLLDNAFANVAAALKPTAPDFPVPALNIQIGGISIKANELQFSGFQKPEIVYSLVQPNLIMGTIIATDVLLAGAFDSRRENIVHTKTNSGKLTYSAPKVTVEFAVEVGDNKLGTDSFTCQAPLAKLDVQELDKIDIAVIKPLLQLNVPKLYTSALCDMVEQVLRQKLKVQLFED